MVCQSVPKDNQTLLFPVFFLFLILVTDEFVKAHAVTYKIRRCAA